MKKRITSILLCLCMMLTMFSGMTVSVWAEPADVTDVVFGYAYDAQRDPAFPTAGAETTFYRLKAPFLSDGTNYGSSIAGSWKLTKVGTYSYVKANGLDSYGLQNITRSVQNAYGLSAEQKEGIVIYELKNGEEHIAYGVVVVYNSTRGYAGFIGDSLSSGAGYMLATNEIPESQYNSGITATAIQIATDFVQTNTTIALKDASNNDVTTVTFDPATVGYGTLTEKEITVENTGTVATEELQIALSSTNEGSFTLSTDSISSIAVGDKGSFTVVPNDGLAAGTYTATVTVSGANVVAQSFVVSFQVTGAAHVHSLTLVTQVDPTCTTAGKQAYWVCGSCNMKFSDDAGNNVIDNFDEWGNIDPLGHDYSTVISRTSESHTLECTRCHDTKTEAHTFGNDNTCGICGYTYPSYVIITPPITPTEPEKPDVITPKVVEHFATATGAFDDIAYFCRKARAGDVVTLKVSNTDEADRLGFDYHNIRVEYEVEGCTLVRDNIDYHGNPLYKDGIAAEFRLAEGLNKVTATVYYNDTLAGTFDLFYCNI